MGDDPVVTGLVTRARNGDEQAWNALVERYAPLIWSICRSHCLAGAGAGDVSRRVWLQLAGHLDMLRDPAALPRWLATAARRECRRAQRAAHGTPAAGPALAAGTTPGQQAQTAEQQLLVAERDAVLREAFARLPPCCRRLLTLLTQEPPLSYAAVSTRLNIPAGSIGPKRGRCLDRLRRDPAIAALTSAEAAASHPAAAGSTAAVSGQPPDSYPAAPRTAD